MSNVSNVKETLRQFIVKTYLPGEAVENLQDDTPLRTSGVLDSMATLGLVSFVEKEFDIELEAHETGIETFDTVGGIADLIVQKRGGR
jgi:acyl carrier protein